MNLRSVDLNLLVALDALLNERHITRAAARIGLRTPAEISASLGPALPSVCWERSGSGDSLNVVGVLSQPAMSNALGRLRDVFKDELLVRSARGMQPTPRAEELRRSIQPLLRQIGRVFETDAGFDPTLSSRTFTIRLSDLLGFLLLPALLDQLNRHAPAVGLDVLHLPPAMTVDALERDEIDLAVSMGLEHSNTIRSEIVFRDRMVCIMRKSHALSRRELTLENFLAQRHLKVSMSPTDLRFVDDVLARQKLQRQVALNVPHWLLVPHVLVGTDFVSVMPETLARAVAGRALVFRNLPFASDPFNWTLYWHRRHDSNQAISWLRETVRNAGTGLRGRLRCPD